MARPRARGQAVSRRRQVLNRGYHGDGRHRLRQVQQYFDPARAEKSHAMVPGGLVTSERGRIAMPRSAPIDKLRKICLALPDVVEKEAWGEPTFRVRGRMFAMYDNNHHDAGRIAVLVQGAVGIPKHDGRRGARAILRAAL